MTAQAATQLSKAVHITSHTRVVCGSAARGREAGRVQIACVVFLRLGERRLSAPEAVNDWKPVEGGKEG